jgi:KDEL-tailed cysteine endopeptidase
MKFTAFLPLFSVFTVFSVFLGSLDSVVSKEVFGFGMNGEITQENEWQAFLSFQNKYNKVYKNMEHFETRFNIFRDNLHFIISHNSQNENNFTLNINHFADFTNEEFKEYYANGFVLQNYNFGSNLRGLQNKYGCKLLSSSEVDEKLIENLPSSMDWRKKGAVTSVKDQGQCGSCWTFSSTATTEGAWAIATGNLIDLSEQELVDCATGFTYGSHGCSGGQMDGAFKFIIQNGLCPASQYPYVSGTTKTGGTCQSKSCQSEVRFSSCTDVQPNDELLLKFAVAQQPIAVAIEADTKYFQFYSGGVLDSTQCGTKLDHGVMIAGYGEENGQKYWLVKNSWSTSWGDEGYVKIARSDSRNDEGICGIAMQPSFINF